MKTLQDSQIMRTISILIALCLISIPAQAKYGGGSGTAEDPYQIATAADLIALGEDPNDYDKHFIMTDNIDLDPNLPGGKVFDKAVIAWDTVQTTPWFEGTSFTGIFDGNGHTISHMTIKGVGCLGLFGHLESAATVKDLGLVVVKITGSDWYVAALVGLSQGSVSRCYATGAVSGRDGAGGLIGDSRGSVTQCYSTCIVTGNSYVGGLVGYNYGPLTQCYSAGAVSGADHVGGLVGVGGAIACFWDTQTSGQVTSAAGTGLATAEMQMATTFLCWLLKPAVWTIDEGRDYPRLWWQNAPGEPLTRVYYYGGGTGTQADPYLLYTPEQLSMIGLSVCDLDKHFKLMADIDLSAFDGQDGRPPFNIIAPDTDSADQWFQGTAFTGVFDGNGHTISHLTITGKDYVGLFGQLGYGAEVKDVHVADANITGSGGYYVGALAGYNLAAVTRCYSTGAVTGSGDVGGLVGLSGGNVTNCYSTGAVSGSTDVGGLVGYMPHGSIAYCYSACTVRGDAYVGGLVGANALCMRTICRGGLINDCYSTSTVKGTSSVGGLVGWNEGDVTRCYGTGTVSGTGQYVGGLVGDGWPGGVTVSLWDTETSGQATSAGGTGKTTAEMRTAKTFVEANWDFVNIWGIGENQTYPYLRKYSAADVNQDASVNFLDLAALADNWLTDISDRRDR